MRTSRGVRRYFLPASVATIYCEGCERMRFRAEDVVRVCSGLDGCDTRAIVRTTASKKKKNADDVEGTARRCLPWLVEVEEGM